MKIIGNYYSPQVAKNNMGSKVKAEKPGFKQQISNMDSITINAPKDKLEETKFISALKKEVAADIKVEKTAEELDAIADRISRGTYVINAEEIVRKMLLG